MRKKRTVTMLTAVLTAICILTGCAQGVTPTPIEVPQSTENDITAEQVGALDDPSIANVEETTVPEETKEEQEEPEVEISYSDLPAQEVESVSDNEISTVVEDEVKKTEDGKIIVDLVMFMGQSNMSGAGGNASYAPKVKMDHGYEFRAISDPTRLYPIEEPFGQNENNLNGIYDLPGAKKGSLVSAFANRYYEETGVPIVAVSASQGGTDTDFWQLASTTNDFSERQKRAQVWLESNNYYIRKQYVIWLQGESDALDNITVDEYKQNMDNIIRPLFIGGVQKVFIITPGRILEIRNFFDNIVDAQLQLCKDSGYYALATTVLSAVSTEYMIDSWHYNQTVLNLLGDQAAISAAYYTNNKREMCLYDYKHDTTYIPDGFDYTGNEVAEPLNINEDCGLTRY
ncbi:MAG: sialate O-acetylesterase [Lachnospiraceae bacterium]|nr:sialate O-acetylesterase [Lachnospiraceae bacterium]